MSLLDHIIDFDRQSLIFLNALGSNTWDGFWLEITNKYNWIPLYLLVFFLLFKNYGWKKALFTILIAVLLVTFIDQFVNLIKNSVGRLRPNHDPSINTLIRVVKNAGGYSFVSGHATNSFGVATFLILTLRNYFKPIYFILIWPILFAYSRVYLGVHYPLDIFAGGLLGVVIGWGFYKFWELTAKKMIILKRR